MDFGDYVRHYELARSEGLVLRYLSDAYKALRRTIPEDRKTPELLDLTEWLGELVRQTDSSLLDEWAALVDPSAAPSSAGRPRREPSEPPPLTSNRRAFTILVRNAMFQRVELAAAQWWDALEALDPDRSAAWWAEELAPYFAEHAGEASPIGIGPDARNPALLLVDESPAGAPRTWAVRQILDDPAHEHGWTIDATVDLDASDAEGTAVVHVTAISSAR